MRDDRIIFRLAQPVRLAKQVGVCASGHQAEYGIVFDVINQQPVRRDVAFPVAGIVTMQLMRPASLRQIAVLTKNIHDLDEEGHIESTPLTAFTILFEFCTFLDRPHAILAI